MILLSIFLYKTITNIYHEQQQIFFTRALFSQIVYIFMDIIWFLCYKQIIIPPPRIYTLINLFQWFIANACGYHWFIYSESMRRAKYIEYARARRLIFLPVWIGFLPMLSSITIGFPMRLNPDGSFYGMAYYSSMMILPFLYVSAAGVHFLVQFYRENKSDRHLLSFVIYPAIISISGFVQAVFLEVPLLCYAYVIDMLIYYMNMQDTHISLDSLTKLNNRNSLMRTLRNRFRDVARQEIFYLFMMDIDYFKKINDTFGHPEGDRALKQLAEALRIVCRKQKDNCFIARYGGDEFMMLCDCKTDTEALSIVHQIQQELYYRSRLSSSKYTLEVSIGYVRRDESIASVQELIQKADKKLYKYKHVKTETRIRAFISL